MKKLFCIFLLALFFTAVHAGTVLQNIPQQTVVPQKEDSIKENIVEEDAVIEDIIQTKPVLPEH